MIGKGLFRVVNDLIEDKLGPELQEEKCSFIN